VKTPAFWSSRSAPLALLLWPIGVIYGWVTAWRMKQPGARAALPVICIGNLTAGGTGKTPTVQMLARRLRLAGETPFIISRGYGGRISGPSRVDPALMSAADCGDEPLLLARETPVIVSGDRMAGAVLARDQGATVVLLDDGLQNPALTKDFTIAVVDAGAEFGNGYCIPAGPLRAPVRDQLPKIDVWLSIGPEPALPFTLGLRAFGKPVFTAALEPDKTVLASLRGKALLAFAGIGRPQRFFQTLADAGLNVQRTEAFADHHPYTPSEIEALGNRAAAAKLQLVTTEKDAVRLNGGHTAMALPVSLSLADDQLPGLVLAAIARRRSEP
jgi:tetraacyldisaccharide 4'-kinase